MRIPHPRLVASLALAAATLVGVAAVSATAASSDAASIPIGQTVTGKATYYNDAGYGACGTSIDARTQMLVAVSHTYWTTANPNVDPLCSGISVEATYNGKTITVPVKDKCPSCDATHIDLSEPAFAQLGNLDTGVLTGLTWKFVRSGSPVDSTAPTASEPTATAPTVSGPTATGPSSGGPTATAPTVSGPTATEPSSGGPTATAPTVSGPTVTGPSSGGPTATEPSATASSAPATTASTRATHQRPGSKHRHRCPHRTAASPTS